MESSQKILFACAKLHNFCLEERENLPPVSRDYGECDTLGPGTVGSRESIAGLLTGVVAFDGQARATDRHRALCPRMAERRDIMADRLSRRGLMRQNRRDH